MHSTVCGYTPQYALHTLCVVHTDDTQYFNMQYMYIVMDIQNAFISKILSKIDRP